MRIRGTSLVATLMILLGATAGRSESPSASNGDGAARTATPIPSLLEPTATAKTDSGIDFQLRSLDDSISTYRGKKPILVLGMVGGMVIGTAILIQGMESASKASKGTYGSTTKSSSVNPGYYIGMMGGLALSTICAVQFNSVSGDISLIEWRKRKLELQRPKAALPNGATLTLRF
jgi:hypothetical protein